MQSKVFELFAQIDDHRLERARGGLGIGLALVRQLVELHGGSVNASSPGLGQGSVFRVRLPTVDAPQPATGELPSANTAPSTRSLKVLVVDDNAEVAQTVGWMLEMIGHEYELVHDGQAALEAARAYKPDAILLDIGMPGMDGYAVCRVLRQDEAFRNTPIIAQTGWGQERDKLLASEAGFDHHLVKPVALEALEKILASTPIRHG
jgi:CheY-like chemotaxis protein